MKKARPEVHAKKLPPGTMFFRQLVCKGVQAALGVAVAMAFDNRDKSLRESLERVSSLLRHEMRTFLEVDG